MKDSKKDFRKQYFDTEDVSHKQRTNLLLNKIVLLETQKKEMS